MLRLNLFRKSILECRCIWFSNDMKLLMSDKRTVHMPKALSSGNKFKINIVFSLTRIVICLKKNTNHLPSAKMMEISWNRSQHTYYILHLPMHSFLTNNFDWFAFQFMNFKLWMIYLPVSSLNDITRPTSLLFFLPRYTLNSPKSV